MVLRAAAAAGAGFLAILLPPPAALPVSVGLAAGLIAWTAAFSGLVRRGAGTWLLAVDTVVVAGVCLTQQWTVPPEFMHDLKSWVVGFASVAVATYQWHSSVRGGAMATAAVIAAYLSGSAVAGASPLIALWLGIEAALSRGLFQLVLAGARATDRTTAEQQQVRHEAAIAAARRADERAHLATMHDTAAATLLAIGTGVLDGREPWLAKQIADDLEALTAGPDAVHGQVDLVRLLDETVRRSRVTVSPLTGTLFMPAVPAVAICRSAGEALLNVTRHAGVDAAAILLARRAETVVVEIADQGRGFDPGLVPAHRRGIGLSIVERMESAGGRAKVISSPGGGTRVRLEWPDG